MKSDDQFGAELRQLQEDGLLRSLRTLPGAGGKILVDGRVILNFSSNDYLDLANDPRLKAGAIAAIEHYGCGATSSRLLAGHLDLHEKLERELALLTQQEAALIFPTGFQTNVGVLTALAGPADTIFSDELNHASIVDGCRLSRAAISAYRHNDVEDLGRRLKAAPQTGRRIVITESIFSMDGDYGHLNDIEEIARARHATFVVDEAHAIGLHSWGRGLCAATGVGPDVTIGTLSKALGGEGGFAAGSEKFRDLLINKSRSFIFSTGMAPACVGSAIAAIQVLSDEENRGDELFRRAHKFRTALRRHGLELDTMGTQIIPIVVGENRTAVALGQALFDRGVFAAAVRPPSVPEGTARLRFSVTLAHTEEDLERAAEIVADVMLQAGARSTADVR